jgi:hypothetical protein
MAFRFMQFLLCARCCLTNSLFNKFALVVTPVAGVSAGLGSAGWVVLGSVQLRQLSVLARLAAERKGQFFVAYDQLAPLSMTQWHFHVLEGLLSRLHCSNHLELHVQHCWTALLTNLTACWESY